MLQALNNVQQLPKIYSLILQKLASIEEEGTAASIEVPSTSSCFVPLWRACEYYEDMPRNAEDFATRGKVHYLLSSSIISEVDFSKQLTNMISFRKTFRNMYFMETSKTRLTAMEVLSVIYATPSASNSSSSSSMLENFHNEITTIFNSSSLSLKNTSEILISEGQSLLKSIPILSSAAEVRSWQLRFAEQQENFETPAFDDSSFKDVREFFVMKAIQRFSVASAASSDDAATASKNIETLKMSIVSHIRTPDYFVMRVFQLLRANLSVSEQVELFYLTEMKCRHVDAFRLKKLAKQIESVKLKHLPFADQEIDQLRSAIDVFLSMGSSSEEQHDHSDLFTLALVWIITLFAKVIGTEEVLKTHGDLHAKVRAAVAAKGEEQGIFSVFDAILIQTTTSNESLRRVCESVSEEIKTIIKEGNILKASTIVMRLFSIRQSFFETSSTSQLAPARGDCLSELVRDDYELQFAEVSHDSNLEDFAAACVIERALKSVIDFSSHESTLSSLAASKQQLIETKKRLIFRGFSGDNIAAFTAFFEENLPFIEKIESFLPLLETVSAKSVKEEENRALREAKKHIENWLHMSF